MKLHVLFVLLCYLGRPFSDQFFLVLLLSPLALNIHIIQSVITIPIYWICIIWVELIWSVNSILIIGAIKFNKINK